MKRLWLSNHFSMVRSFSVIYSRVFQLIKFYVHVSFALKKYILCKIREKSYVSVTHKLNLRDTFRIPEMQYKVRTKYNVRAYFNSKCCSSAGLQVARCQSNC